MVERLYMIWAWYPGGFRLYRVEADWDKAVAAYREAKADTNGPVYLTEKKKVDAVESAAVSAILGVEWPAEYGTKPGMEGGNNVLTGAG